MAPENCHSRNATICASCSSLLDGMEDLPNPAEDIAASPGDETQESHAEVPSDVGYKGT